MPNQTFSRGWVQIAQLVSEALKYGRGYVRVGEVERNIAERRDAPAGKSPEFITVQHGRPNTPGRQSPHTGW